jgi:hypothetical protein
MKKIVLTKGLFAKVDDIDFENVLKYNWCAVRNHKSKSGVVYAKRNVRKGVMQTLHSFIIGNKNGCEIDHINGDGLDNRRLNLRHVGRGVNIVNSLRVGRSGIRGVHEANGCWKARIQVNGVVKNLGSFSDIKKAENSRFVAERRIYGVRRFEKSNHVELIQKKEFHRRDPLKKYSCEYKFITRVNKEGLIYWHVQIQMNGYNKQFVRKDLFSALNSRDELLLSNGMCIPD